ncbi:MAG: hypothetical protein JXQ73_26540 [Phycisphaerae bacterium]|nr:hypothetical protein [Phycisphaerae bacterium]
MSASLIVGIAITLAAPGAGEPKVLNNLVTELLSVESRPIDKQTTLDFTNPRQGWVFVSSSVRPANNAAVSVDLDGKPAYRHESPGTLEAMRFLPQGPHALSLRAAEKTVLDRLVVRAVPELVYAKCGANPHVVEYGKYDWAFLQKHVLANLNVMVGAGGLDEKPFADQWRRQGKRWIIECGVPGLGKGQTVTPDQAYEYWATNPGMADPLFDGLIADEFFGNDDEKYKAWSDAVRRIRANPAFKDKRYYPYCTSMYQGDASSAFVKTVMDAGYAFAFERYLREPREPAVTAAIIESYFRKTVADYAKKIPGSPGRMIVCLGTFSQPPESLDANPSVNYKVFLDMQMHLLANDPGCRGLYGVMTYLSSYTDEETVRWMGKLFRHYCIEGRRGLLSRDPLVLPHVQNPDFEDGLSQWRVEPAAPGCVDAKTKAGFSWLQGRYPRTQQGDTVLWMRRSKNRPNRVSQTVKALQPGRLYSVKMFSGDFKDLSTKQKLAVSIRLQNVDVLAGKSFQHVFANCYSHHYPPYDQQHKAWMNYHWIVFRATAPEARIEITDWADPTTPGGPIGQELMMNFLEVQPYLDE